MIFGGIEMEIRKYKPEYKKQLQQVCLNTAPPEALTDATFGDLILSTYCNYYLEKEPENSFALVDDEDNAQGYIFSAVSYRRYLKGIIPYMKHVKEIAGKDVLEPIREIIVTGILSVKYPAHMHIDINDGFRGSGNGTKMVTTMLDHLRSKNIKGVMLIVGTDNKRGQNFYRKNGFHTVLVTKDGTVMGRKL